MITALAHDQVTRPANAPRATDVAVSVRHLSKRFLVRRKFMDVLLHPFAREWAHALNDLSCDVHTGEFFGFLGANGAGKTTLFKVLATLISPDKGAVTVHGHDVMKSPAEVRRILTPVIADERSLRWRLNARENLRLYAVLYNTAEEQLRDRVDEMLKLVGLDPDDNKMVGRFSSGMRQRLLIARALIARPRILLLDEPTRSLDPVSARALRSFLRDELCRGLGCTVLLATHSAEEAFELCDRIAILDRGRPVVIEETEKLILRFSQERYTVWTRTPAHAAIGSLVPQGLATAVTIHRIDDDGWAKLDLDIPGGLESASRAMNALVQRGVVIARFERTRISLGELMQRAIERANGDDCA